MRQVLFILAMVLFPSGLLFAADAPEVMPARDSGLPGVDGGPAVCPQPMPLTPPMSGPVVCPMPMIVPINETSNGATVRIFKGQTLSLTLGENPSTGYRWAIEDYKPSVLELTDQIFKPGSNNAPGASGKKIYDFLGKKIGESDLLIQLIRPWEDNVKPLKTFTLKIVVKEKGPSSK